MTRKLYQELAGKIAAIENCKAHNNNDWQEHHTHSLLSLVNDYMPSGCGIDSGTEIVLDECKPEKLVFSFGYHHMNEQGFYTHWTEHKAIVTPSLFNGLQIKITGIRKADYDLSDSLWETFEQALTQEI